MYAQPQSIMALLDSGQVFDIPVYQRNYDWKWGNCKKLLEDIKNLAKRIAERNSYKHFIGCIVLISANDNMWNTRRADVIDGQQRMTTVLLIVKALSAIAHQHQYVEYYQRANRYLFDDGKSRLTLNRNDQEQFDRILQDDFENCDEDSILLDNYLRIKEFLITTLNDFAARGTEYHKAIDLIGAALHNLHVVGIAMERGQDSPHLIFESINSTGLSLTTSDLIRNYILMQADDMNFLCEKYWFPIEKLLRCGDDYKALNSFFAHYISYKNGSNIKESHLYDAFKMCMSTLFETPEECLKELLYFARLYSDLWYARNKYVDADIKQELSVIKDLKQTTCFPFLLHVIDDFKNNKINKQTLKRSLRIIIKWLVRRQICGFSSNSYSKFFASLYSRIFAITANLQKYPEAIQKYLTEPNLPEAEKSPSDEDVRQSLLEIPLYSKINLCRYLMQEIENGGRQDYVDTRSMTIEHILPQTLNAAWSHFPQIEHETLVHTLGNLTLTTVNSELGNKSFSDKKTYYRESHATFLNRDICNKSEWNASCIRERSKTLASVILNRFELKPINDDSICFEVLNPITLKEHENSLTNRKIRYIEYKGERLYCTSLIEIYKYVLPKIKDIEFISQIAEEGYKQGNRGKKYLIHNDADTMRKPQQLPNCDDIWVETNISAKGLFSILKELHLQAKENLESLTFYVYPLNNNNEFDSEFEDEQDN